MHPPQNKYAERILNKNQHRYICIPTFQPDEDVLLMGQLCEGSPAVIIHSLWIAAAAVAAVRQKAVVEATCSRRRWSPRKICWCRYRECTHPLPFSSSPRRLGSWQSSAGGRLAVPVRDKAQRSDRIGQSACLPRIDLANERGTER